MFITIVAKEGNININIDHITHMTEDRDPNRINEIKGTWIHILSKNQPLWTSLNTHAIISLIEQVYAAERAAYTMFVDQNGDEFGWPVNKYEPKDRN